ncbi:MAG: glycosyltransferase family 39 protein [Salibacteraceae bacterium]
MKLGSAHIRLWDEGWFVVHAIEMMKEGSWFVSYFDGQPSITSSKPPLQTWLQIASLKMFGISELAVRLPSAIASSLSVLMLFFFTGRKLGQPMAWLTSMILLTSIGFIGFHTSRGAEADALLTLTLVAQAIFFFQFVQTREWRWLFLAMTSIGVAFWVKSVAAFLFLPGFAVYSLLFSRDTILIMLKSWQFYVGIATVVAIIGSYLLLRENAQPGYLAMFFKSNVGRYTSSVGHDQPWDFYIRNMLDGRYMWWMPFAFLGFLLAFTELSEVKSWVVFSSIIALSFLIFIGFSKSKLVWYDMPFYPMAAVSAAYAIKYFTYNLQGLRRIALLLLLFTFPVYQMFAHTQANRLRLQEMEFEAQEIFLANAYRERKEMDNTIVVHDHFHGALLFYKHKFEQVGDDLILTNSLDSVEKGAKVLIKDPSLIDELMEQWKADSIDSCRDAVLYKIKGAKNNSQKTNE